MYDMSGFDYDIRDVVRVLNLRIRHKNTHSYDVDCPFCNYKTGKMNVNIERNVSAAITATSRAACWICMQSCTT